MPTKISTDIIKPASILTKKGQQINFINKCLRQDDIISTRAFEGRPADTHLMFVLLKKRIHRPKTIANIQPHGANYFEKLSEDG